MNLLGATFVGHSTTLIEVGGSFFLTDPVLGSSIPARARISPPGMSVDSLPPISAVLVSHAHYDHLDVKTLMQLDRYVPIITPPRAALGVWGLSGRRIIELALWSSIELDGVRITAVPARHFGGRYLADSLLRPAAGFVVEKNDLAAYFAGDTAYFDGFAEIGSRFDLDLALLPIGAYRPRWLMFASHMGPEQAVRAFGDLGADFLIPIHWGAFKLSLEPLAEPVALLRQIASEKALDGRVIILEPGKSWTLEK
ncbi:MAG: MBL fold metallo-hydrolase [Desulfatibacillaceae bacterium]|nr:MBL fold metallo-hydrolase [Desulfatibacillaceae bacterium]